MNKPTHQRERHESGFQEQHSLTSPVSLTGKVQPSTHTSGYREAAWDNPHENR